jgi:DNA polymerase-3 subunit gamma/tau
MSSKWTPLPTVLLIRCAICAKRLTTEAHKLPETIISRTQRFNFKPISTSDITTHLGTIAAAEGITIEPGALDIIATASRGGFRDAISMMDQLAASGLSPITAGVARQLLGYSDAEEIAALNRALAASDTRAALEITARLEAGGAQPTQVAIQLADEWRAVLLTAAGAAPATNPTVAELAASIPAGRAARILESLLEITRSPWPQPALEATLVRLTVPESAGPTPAAPPTATAPPTPPASPAPAPPKPSKPAASSPEAKSPGPTTTTGALNAALWPKVLVLIKSQNNSLAALLQMYPVDFGDGEVTIKPRFNFHRDLFLKPMNRTAIEAAATKVYGRPIKLSARTEESGAKIRRPKSDPNAELISSALEILGGEIVE